VNYTNLIKALALPVGYAAALELRYEDITARALSRADLVADVKGINASIDLIRRTRGGEWPSAAVSEEFDYVDLVWHECELRENYSFSYAVYEGGGQYIGCCYLYPMGRRTRLDAKLIEHDVDVSWWVTGEAYDRGYYGKVYRALQEWVIERFPFTKPHYSNREVP
jgi:hypothetical protein